MPVEKGNMEMSKKLGLDIDLFVGMLALVALSALFAVLITLQATDDGASAQQHCAGAEDQQQCRDQWIRSTVEAETRGTVGAETLGQIEQALATLESKLDTVQPARIQVLPRGAEGMLREQTAGIQAMHRFMVTAEADYPDFLSSGRDEHLLEFQLLFESVENKLSEFDELPTATR